MPIRGEVGTQMHRSPAAPGDEGVIIADKWSLMYRMGIGIPGQSTGVGANRSICTSVISKSNEYEFSGDEQGNDESAARCWMRLSDGSEKLVTS